LLAEPLADEVVDETEVGDLDRAVVLLVQLEVSGGYAVRIEYPDGDAGIGEMGGALLIGPREAGSI
jgi:hypothetical protein